MKKNLLFFFILFLSVTSRAQSWCPPGATWYYRDINTNPDTWKDGTLELKFTHTVTINNVVCKEIKGTFYGASNHQDPSYYEVPDYVTYRTYENNNVVYIFNVSSQQFDTIANFNAHIADSWFYALNSSFCTDINVPRNRLTVYDTGHVVINTVSLKKLVVSPLNVTPQNVIIEKIGGMPGFLFIMQDCSLDGSTMGNFSCYTDDNFLTYKKAGITDCNFNTVSIMENVLSNQYIKLYPNPNSGNFKLDLQNGSQITIYNALGSEVYTNTFTSPGTYDIAMASASPGIYYLKTHNNSGHSYSKFIKQ